MGPTILTSIIGIIIFSIIMFFGYKYANGKWNVSGQKKNDYLNWTITHGKRVKKGIIMLSIIYGVLMFIQISSLL